MKIPLLLPIVTLLAVLSVDAQAFLAPTNAPPQVQLAWNPVSGASTYSVYYGVGSGQYTNRVTGITGTNTTITLPARGVKYFFAATDTESHGLESQFSNEVNYTPPSPLSPPTMQPITVLTVQWAPTPTGQFVDSGMNWSLSETQAQQYYRLAIQRSFILATLTPPIPHK